MISTILKKIIGSRNDRLIKQYSRQVRAINALEPQMEKLSDAELAAKTAEFRKRVEDRLARVPDDAADDPERKQQREAERVQARKDALDELLPEAARRARPFLPAPALPRAVAFARDRPLHRPELSRAGLRRVCGIPPSSRRAPRRRAFPSAARAR